ncbi:ABC transporter permease subunit [Haladaptatus sp. DYSN1]|uniref:ABC transporter permease subunit n=2 Tax=unclassified Haladaptatus TaxID=2622732 RepID=UPI0034E97347
MSRSGLTTSAMAITTHAVEQRDRPVACLTLMVLNVYVIERLFGIGGIGRLSLFAILQRDLPLVIGTAMIIVLASVVISLLQDVANTIIDPRVAGDA